LAGKGILVKGELIMRKLFTKNFFNLSSTDQAKLVGAALHELETAVYVSQDDERRAHRSAAYIRKKAVEYGIMEGKSQKE
jgi:hypothetical protein